MMLRFDELLGRVSVEIEAAIHNAIIKCEGTVVESDDIRQEIVARLGERWDYIKSTDAPIACAQKIVRDHAQRCLRWLLPQYPPAPQPREGDKTVYANDWERSLTGPQAVAYSQAREEGTPFEIEDY